MNRSKISVLSFYLIFLVACSSETPKNLLESPPFVSLTDSIRQFPNDHALRLRRAQLLAQNNQHELATGDLQKAWELQPDAVTAMAYISNLFLVNKPNQALNLLKEANKKFPDNPEFKRRLSEAYLQNGNAVQALSMYDSILMKDPDNFEAWYNKGILLAENNDTPAAINALEHSYQLQPLTMNAIPLANLYAETNNPKTLTVCDELIAKDSLAVSVEPYYLKGIYFSNTGQDKLAIEQFDECIRKDWKFSDAYIEKGIALYEMKNIDEALQTFKIATEVTPRNPDAYYWTGRCFESIGKIDEAIDNYRRTLALDKTFSEARDHLDKLQKQK